MKSYVVIDESGKRVSGILTEAEANKKKSEILTESVQGTVLKVVQVLNG